MNTQAVLNVYVDCLDDLSLYELVLKSCLETNQSACVTRMFDL